MLEKIKDYLSSITTDKIKAILLITVMWIFVLAVGVSLAVLFNGRYFIIRFVLTVPLVWYILNSSIKIWKLYK